MSRQAPKVGVYYGDSDWREDANFTWFPSDYFQSSIWHSSDPANPAPSLRLVHKITERVVSPPIHDHGLVFATAVFVADDCSQDEHAKTVKQVIVKVFQRIPNLPVPEGKEYVSARHLFSHQLPIVEDHADESPGNYDRELDALQHLTRQGFSRAPSFVGHFVENRSNPWVKNGFLGFIVMEKLSAITISDIWEFKPTSAAQSDEQLLIQESFKTTYLEMSSLGVASMDSGARNLMWDSKSRKCYCIDFEMAVICEPPSTLQTWEELTATHKHQFITFNDWGIIMDDQHKNMVKTTNPYVIYPEDE